LTLKGIRLAVAGTALALAAGAGAGAFGVIGEAATASGQTQAPPPPPTQGQGRGGGGGRGGAQQPARDAQAQPIVGTGVISGTVVTEGAGTPVRRARVSLSGAELRGGRSTVTNDEGAFSFTTVPAGRFTMTASKAGYVDITYGAKRPGRPGTPIQLADGQKLENVSISLPRGSVVTGIVIDENGEPSPATQVRVMRYVMRTGEKQLQQAGQDQTDDRGMYRIYGLQPGDYMVSATPRNMNIGDLRQTIAAEIEMVMQQAQAAAGRGGGAGGGGGRGGRGGAGIEIGQIMGGGRGQALLDRAAELQQQLQQQEQAQNVAYAPVYYPGTTMPSGAATVTLGIGEERAGVDFQLQLVATAKVSGLVQSADGTLPQGTQIRLMRADQAGTPMVPGAGASTGRVGPDGRFTLNGVTPGQYRLMASATLRQMPAAGAAAAAPGAPGGRGGPGGGRGGQIVGSLWAVSDITVSGQDIADVVMNLQSGMTVSGRVSFEGSALLPPTDLTRVRVSLSPRGQQSVEFNVPPAQLDSTGRFTIPGVAPGRYTLSANAPSGGGARQGGAGQPAGQWVLKSAMAGTGDMLDFGLTVEPGQDVTGATLTFVDRTQEVSGTIQDLQGKPTADYTIIVFSADNRYWLPQSRRIMSSRPGTDGKFSFRNLPAGDYRLTAVTDVEPGEWFNPDFLSQLVGASIAFTLNEGERKVQDIRLAGG